MSEVATRDPMQELVAQVRGDAFKQQVAMALPGNVPPERFVRATVTALRENPDILRADRDSLFSALVKSAQDGLIPDGREAAIVMFGSKATYLAMIGGLRKIAAEHGWSIRTQVVYSNDEFAYELGLEPKLIHRPAPLRDSRGELIGAYAVATHRDGRKEVEVFTREEVEKVRATSRASQRGPWVEWPERMWEKTVGRRLFAKLPLDDRDPELIARVLEASRELEPGEAAEQLYGRTVTPERAPADSPDVVAPTSVAGQQAEEPSTRTDGSDHTGGSSAPDFDGEEPGASAAPPNETQPIEPTFGSGRYAGKTIVQVYSEGKEGISYIKWAVKGWKTDPMKSALAAFAETHPEIR